MSEKNKNIADEIAIMAKLSRLSIDGNRRDKLVANAKSILEYASDLPPYDEKSDNSSSMIKSAPLRNDTVLKSKEVDDIIDLLPFRSDRFCKVRKVINAE